jgi:hypothetical protein
MTNNPHAPAEPTILGLNRANFVAAYFRSRPPAVRALGTITDPTARQKAASALAVAGALIDYDIDVTWEFGDPFETTWLRMGYGITSVLNWSGDAAGDPGTTTMPVPPVLTPYPDPPIKANQFVGPLLRSGSPAIVPPPVLDANGNYAGPPTPDIYTALPRGWQCNVGVVVVETNGDGNTYERVSQLQPGDPIALFVRIK